MSPRKKFDVFLSHNSRDKPWVKNLKADLEQAGIRVWLDREQIRPGDLFAKALEKGIAESRSVALIISPESMSSGWVENEYYRALNLATDGQLQLIPVLYKQAQLPGFLQDRNWVDLSNESDYDEQLKILIWGITGKKDFESGNTNDAGSVQMPKSVEYEQLIKGTNLILFKIEHSSYNYRLSNEQKHLLKELFTHVDKLKPAGEFPMNKISEISEIEAAGVFDQTTKSVAYFLSSLAVHQSKWAKLVLADSTTEQSMRLLEAIEDQILIVSRLVEQFSSPQDYSIYHYETRNVLDLVSQLQNLLNDLNNHLISGNLPPDVLLKIERLFDDLVFYTTNYVVIVNDLAQIIKKQKPLLQ